MNEINDIESARDLLALLLNKVNNPNISQKYHDELIQEIISVRHRITSLEKKVRV